MNRKNPTKMPSLELLMERLEMEQESDPAILNLHKATVWKIQEITGCKETCAYYTLQKLEREYDFITVVENKMLYSGEKRSKIIERELGITKQSNNKVYQAAYYYIRVHGKDTDFDLKQWYKNYQKNPYHRQPYKKKG